MERPPAAGRSGSEEAVQQEPGLDILKIDLEDITPAVWKPTTEAEAQNSFRVLATRNEVIERLYTYRLMLEAEIPKWTAEEQRLAQKLLEREWEPHKEGAIKADLARAKLKIRYSHLKARQMEMEIKLFIQSLTGGGEV